jgi:hypothetical protein
MTANMDVIRDLDAESNWLLDACLKRISQYPPELRQPARARLEKHWSLEQKRPRAFHIAFLLPFWLKEPFSLDRDACRLVGLSNIFLVLYFMLQDELMDCDLGLDQRYLQPLGTFFFVDVMASYERLFGPGSAFWTRFEQTIAQWGLSISWERRWHWGQARAFEEADLRMLAHKAAPLKIPCAALCSLAGREQAIGTLEKTIDDLMMAFLLMDDLRDWRGDLAQGSYTYFLTRVAAHRGLDPHASLTETDVEKALFVGAVLDEYMEMMIRYNRLALESVSTLDVPYLRAYIVLLDQDGRQLREELEAKRSKRIREQFAALIQEAPAPAADPGAGGKMGTKEGGE